MNIEQQTKLQHRLRDIINDPERADSDEERFKDRGAQELAKTILTEFFPEDPLNNPQAKPEAKSNGGW